MLWGGTGRTKRCLRQRGRGLAVRRDLRRCPNPLRITDLRHEPALLGRNARRKGRRLLHQSGEQLLPGGREEVHDLHLPVEVDHHVSFIEVQPAPVRNHVRRHRTEPLSLRPNVRNRIACYGNVPTLQDRRHLGLVSRPQELHHRDATTTTQFGIEIDTRHHDVVRKLSAQVDKHAVRKLEWTNSRRPLPLRRPPDGSPIPHPTNTPSTRNQPPCHLAMRQPPHIPQLTHTPHRKRSPPHPPQPFPYRPSRDALW